MGCDHRDLILALTERVAKQSELLSKKAERTMPSLILKVADRGETTSTGHPVRDVYLQRQHDKSRETLLYRLQMPLQSVERLRKWLSGIAKVEESRSVPPAVPAT